MSVCNTDQPGCRDGLRQRASGWLRCWQGRLLVVLLLLVPGFWLDKPMYEWSRGKSEHGLVSKFKLTAVEFGDPLGITFICATVWALDPRRRRPLILSVAAVLLAGGTASSMKLLIGRDRPNMTEGRNVWRGPQLPSPHQPDSSFPSGHTTAAFALAHGLSQLYPHGRGAFLLLAAACGMSRVLSGKHFLTDALLGGWLGWEVARLVWTWGLRRRFGHWLPECKSYPRWNWGAGSA